MHERGFTRLRDDPDSVRGLIFEALARRAVGEAAEHTGADHVQPDQHEGDLIPKRKRRHGPPKGVGTLKPFAGGSAEEESGQARQYLRGTQVYTLRWASGRSRDR